METLQILIIIGIALISFALGLFIARPRPLPRRMDTPIPDIDFNV